MNRAQRFFCGIVRESWRMDRGYSDAVFALRLRSIAYALAPLAVATSCSGRTGPVACKGDASVNCVSTVDAASVRGSNHVGAGGNDEAAVRNYCEVDDRPWYIAAEASIVPDTVAKCEALCGCISRFGSIVDCLWNDLPQADASMIHADYDGGVRGTIPTIGAGERMLKCRLMHPGGRRPFGLRPAKHDVSCVISAYFAELAHLEAASIRAFATLARELAEHDAPPDLVRAAESARRDEIRHARTMRRFARRKGARVGRVEASSAGTRSLEAIAIENAVEGCVLETYSAVLAFWQAKNAGDHEVAAAMGDIAEDEARHAALAWRVSRWAMPRLSAHAKDRLRFQVRMAVKKLENAVTLPVNPALVRELGLPTPAFAQALVAGLQHELW